MSDRARTPTYPVPLPPERREEWQRLADARGESLAVFIVAAVEDAVAFRRSGRVSLRVESVPDAPWRPAVAVPGGKVFRGPDPKVKQRPKQGGGG